MPTQPKRNRVFIEQTLFEQIMDCLPIASVEAVIVQDDALLVMKRKNKPVMGEWWFPGGRIRRGESFEEALRREIKEETGLDLVSFELLNVYCRVFAERHDITIAYLCHVKRGEVVLDGEHSEYAFFPLDDMPVGLHPCMAEVIADLHSKKHF